jgi:hypothetical protein
MDGTRTTIPLLRRVPCNGDQFRPIHFTLYQAELPESHLMTYEVPIINAVSGHGLIYLMTLVESTVVFSSSSRTHLIPYRMNVSERRSHHDRTLCLTSGRAVRLTLVASGEAAAQSSSPIQVRPAHVTESRRDEFLQRVESGLATAKAGRVPGAQVDLREAQELCAAGETQEGMDILRETLRTMHQP